MYKWPDPEPGKIKEFLSVVLPLREVLPGTHSAKRQDNKKTECFIFLAT